MINDSISSYQGYFMYVEVCSLLKIKNMEKVQQWNAWEGWVPLTYQRSQRRESIVTAKKTANMMTTKMMTTMSNGQCCIIVSKKTNTSSSKSGTCQSYHSEAQCCTRSQTQTRKKFNSGMPGRAGSPGHINVHNEEQCCVGSSY